MDKLRKIKQRATESGFTLVEVLVGLAIVAVLASIAYPIWIGIQNQQHESAVKQKLSEVAVLIEQESIDNNGFIPKYVPNEVLSDPISKEFTFEHKERLSWCVTARVLQTSKFPFAPPTASVWFVSSDNLVPTKTIACGGTGYEPMEGSSAPWDAPSIATPQITSHNTAWPSANNYANLNSSYSAGSCTLSSSDNSLFNPNVSLRYRVEVQNQAAGREGTVLTTNLSGSTSAAIASMAGFYPGDPYRIRVQSVCTVTTNDGYPYEYYSNWSNYATGTTATFVVPSPTWTALTTSVGVGNSSTGSTFSGNWTSPYTCPTGSSKRYTVAITYPGATNLSTQTVPTTATTLANQALTHNMPGYRHSFALRAICDYSVSGVNINVPSAPSNREVRSPLRPPTGTLTVNDYTSPSETVTVTPSGFVLNRGATSQFVCAAGSPVVTMNAVDSAGAVYAARTVSFGAVADFFAEILAKDSVHKNLTVTGNVKCSGIVDGQSQTSPVSPNTATGTFTIRYKIPSIPDAPTGFSSDAAGNASYNNDRLLWNAVSCEFDATPEYEVRQMQKSSQQVFAEGSRPSVGGVLTNNLAVLTNTEIGPGSTVQFEVRARCSNFAGSSAWTEYTTGAGAKWTTDLPIPGRGTDVAGGSSNAYTLNLPAVAERCPAGTTHQAYVVKDRNNNNQLITAQVVSNWVNSAGNHTATFSYTRGYYVGGNGRWRCAGPDAVGQPGAWATGKTWVIPLVHSSVWMSNPGRNPTLHGSCNSGWVSQWRIDGAANFGSYSVYSQSYYNGNYWGSGWFRGWMTCATNYTSLQSASPIYYH